MSGQLNAELNYDIKAELNVNPNGTATWADLGIMFKNISQAVNEVLYQATYLADGGYGSTEVTGGQYTVTLTGDKKEGDPVSDYIFNPDIQYKWGSARKTQLRLTRGLTVITWNVTLANITDAGGDSNQPNAVTLTVHGNGKPTIVTLASNNSALLDELKIGLLLLDPIFVGGQFGYTSSTTSVSDIITATPVSDTSIVTIAIDGVSVNNGEAATWSTGINVVIVTVTNGSATATYTIIVDKS